MDIVAREFIAVIHEWMSSDIVQPRIFADEICADPESFPSRIEDRVSLMSS